MISVAVSACLLGEPCRYDGASRPCQAVLRLREMPDVEFVPVCPEVAGGLPTPRIPSEIIPGKAIKTVCNTNGDDNTEAFRKGAETCLAEARARGCKLAILKAKSPSCGSGLVYDGTFSGKLTAGWGVAAELFRQAGITVVDEKALGFYARSLKTADDVEKLLESRDQMPSMTAEKALGHFRTITKHKLLVMKLCFKVGLCGQGLKHDLSKYAPVEFSKGARYYQGFRSPNAQERDERGFTEAWLHHKGRNKHHFEYWLDAADDTEMPQPPAPMPTRYIVEMFCDRIAACKVYQGDAYTDASPWDYYDRFSALLPLHPATRTQLERMLLMLRDQGEEATFAYVRQLVKSRHCEGPRARF